MNPPRITQAIDGNIAEVSIVAADHVVEALSKLGRTEDVRFSPDFRRMAVAGYGRSTCMLLDVDIRPTAARPELHITDFVELHSDDLNEPHGFDFPNDDTLVVANRSGLVVLFRLPKRIAGERHNPEEGGPKGLDVCARGEIVVVTNEERPLACFHIPSLLAELPGQLPSPD